MNEELNEIIPTNPLDTQLNELVTDIMLEQDPNKTKDLVDLFNWNISKKNVARIQKLNTLYDSITDQMTERVEKRADQFSNSDLLDYVKTIQGAIDVNTKNLAQVQEPPLIVQHNNTQINVNVADTFDREAKARILAVVEATLANAQKSVIDIESTTTDLSSTVEEFDKGETHPDELS